jgi:CheY-like chemotaxis protein
MIDLVNSELKVLIVDDNDRYAYQLKKYLDNLNIFNERAFNAKEGYEKTRTTTYEFIITDVTMETQTSGLILTRNLYKEGCPSNLIIATTGFDFPFVMKISKYILPYYSGVKWMIPKVPLKNGNVIFHPTIKAFAKHPFES